MERTIRLKQSNSSRPYNAEERPCKGTQTEQDLTRQLGTAEVGKEKGQQTLFLSERRIGGLQPSLQKNGSNLQSTEQCAEALSARVSDLEKQSQAFRALEREKNAEIKALQMELELFASDKQKYISKLGAKIDKLKTSAREREDRFETLKEENARLRSHGNDLPLPRFGQDLDSSAANKDDRIRKLTLRNNELVTLLQVFDIPVDQRSSRSVDTSKELSSVNHSIKQIARSLIRSGKHAIRWPGPETFGKEHPELYLLVKNNIGSISDLPSETNPAVRTLMSAVLHDWVFYSDFWTSLSRGSPLFGQYKNVIERYGEILDHKSRCERIPSGCSSLPSPTGSSKFLRNIDRAAHRALITEDVDFREYKLPAKAHSLTLDLVDILQPLLDGPIKLDTIAHIKELFNRCFKLRAQLLLHDNRQYEMVLYMPGDLFDPTTMETETPDGCKVTIPEDKVERRVRWCVHGLLREYDNSEHGKIDQNNVKMVECKDFICRNSDQRQVGKLVSEKAIVILE
ncbi:hypothetical protein GP486_005545 [Trichoglossum hirsutum]|uniref:Uncharacterized protein n=1 Tax=Trichoglossum hirsutum TaxID=265104 RepID=A0A9P8L914_9PEZI|nr:hypothetical protein GP486_005545 [Trichoglossum hirsutum]